MIVCPLSTEAQYNYVKLKAGLENHPALVQARIHHNNLYYTFDDFEKRANLAK
jgi:hypothetical protein